MPLLSVQPINSGVTFKRVTALTQVCRAIVRKVGFYSLIPAFREVSQPEVLFHFFDDVLISHASSRRTPNAQWSASLTASH
jgi:hypothetical protein